MVGRLLIQSKLNCHKSISTMKNQDGLWYCKICWLSILRYYYFGGVLMELTKSEGCLWAMLILIELEQNLWENLDVYMGAFPLYCPALHITLLQYAFKIRVIFSRVKTHFRLKIILTCSGISLGRHRSISGTVRGVALPLGHSGRCCEKGQDMVAKIKRLRGAGYHQRSTALRMTHVHSAVWWDVLQWWLGNRVYCRNVILSWLMLVWGNRGRVLRWAAAVV